MPALLETLRLELRGVADPARAGQMQAYMKSEMPYHGVPAPVARAIFRRVLAEHPITTAAAWQRDVLALWRRAEYREERYGAMALTADRRAKPFQEMRALPMYEEMITSGAWWDYVDEIASHRLGLLLRTQPSEMKREMLRWSKDANMWKRRSSILCQLRFKEDTDTRLLYACIAPSIGEKEFFLRKAIGWALRQYAWTAPEEVARYVKEHEAELSGLSKREALKNFEGGVSSPKGWDLA